MIKIIMLVALVMIVSVRSAPTGLQEIFTLDCEGALHFLPSFGMNINLKVPRLPAMYDFVFKKMYQRALCNCSTLTEDEFRTNYAVGTYQFWFDAITGVPPTTKCASLTSWSSSINKTRSTITSELKLPNGCTSSSCLLQHTIVPGHTVQLAIKQCSSNGYWPYISLSCAGSGCNTLGLMCNSDAECGASQKCYTLPQIANVSGGCTNKRAINDDKIDLMTIPTKALSTVFKAFTSPSTFFHELKGFAEEAQALNPSQKRQSSGSISSSSSTSCPSEYFDPSALENATRAMKMLDDLDVTPYCGPPSAFFGKFINVYRSFYGVTTPFQVPSAILTLKFCIVDFTIVNFSNVTSFIPCTITFNNATNKTEIDCTKVQTWNGAISSGFGSNVFDANRLNGAVFNDAPSAVPKIPPLSIENPVVRIAGVTCDGTFSEFPDGYDGILIQAIANFVSNYGVHPPAPPPPPPVPPTGPPPGSTSCFGCNYSNFPTRPTSNDYYCTSPYYTCLNVTGTCDYVAYCNNWGTNNPTVVSASLSIGAVAGVSAAAASSYRIPALRDLINSFYTIIESQTTCRAQKRGETPLTQQQFKWRYAYPLDSMFYIFTGSETSQPRTEDVWGLNMSDFMSSINTTGIPRLQMPKTCDWEAWKNTKTCSLVYTGLQPLLNAAVTLRLKVKDCGATTGKYLGPEISIDCEGAACQLINTAKSCSSNTDCSNYGSGITCVDYGKNVGNDFDPMNYLFTQQSVFVNNTDTCFSRTRFFQDFQSLSSVFPGFTPSTDYTTLKLCSFDPNTFSANRTDFNVSEWVSSQFSADGAVATNDYFQNVTLPDGVLNQPPTTPSSLSATLSLSFALLLLAIIMIFIIQH